MMKDAPSLEYILEIPSSKVDISVPSEYLGQGHTYRFETPSHYGVVQYYGNECIVALSNSDETIIQSTHRIEQVDLNSVNIHLP